MRGGKCCFFFGHGAGNLVAFITDAPLGFRDNFWGHSMGKFLLLFFLVASIAKAEWISWQGGVQRLCERAYIDLGGGNFRMYPSVVAVDNNIVAVSTYGQELGTHQLWLMGRQHGELWQAIDFAKDKIVDLEFSQQELWVLTNDPKHRSRLHRLDLRQLPQIEKQSFPTIHLDIEWTTYSRAYGLGSDDDFVYIAHGNQGLVKFSKAWEKPTELFTNQVNPAGQQISYMTDVVVHDERVFAVWDNQTYDFGRQQRAFEGYQIFSKAGQSLRLLAIEQRREALFEPKLFIDQGQMVMSTWTLHFVNPIEELLSRKSFQPRQRIYQYDGYKPIGLPFVKEGSIWGCFKDERELPPRSLAGQFRYR